MFILSCNSTLADPGNCMCGKVISPWLSIQQYTSQISENGFDIQARRVVYPLISSFCVVCCIGQTKWILLSDQELLQQSTDVLACQSVVSNNALGIVL